MKSSVKKSNRINIAFLGRGRLGMDVLKSILKDNSILVKVIFTCAATPEVEFNEQDFHEIASKNKIDFFKCNTINNVKYRKILQSHNLDLGIAMLWLNTISQEIINTAKLGFINCHGGYLPKYRGNACYNWAILNEEKEAGVTVHFMDGGKLDTGPIILQEKTKITNTTYVGELVNFFNTAGTRLVLKSIRLIQKNKHKQKTQNKKFASYCYPRILNDGEIDWKKSSSDIYRLIRATSKPYPGAYCYFHDVTDNKKIKKLTIWKGHIETHHLKKFYAVPGHLLKFDLGNKWGILCGDMKLIILDHINIDKENIEPYKFFKSVRQRMGLELSRLIVDIVNKQ